jgi:hypothetical protein
MSFIKSFALLFLTVALVVGCASSQMKTRKAERDKVSATSKLYCDFVNGDVYPDIEVALNIEMARRCDSSKAMSMTSYRSPSEATGIIYCCAMREKEEMRKKEVEPKTLWEEPGINKKPLAPSESSSPSSPGTPSVDSTNPNGDLGKDLKKGEKK